MSTNGRIGAHGSFRAFEHTGWQQIPDAYHDGFADLTSQSAEPLLNATGVGAGTRVLDVATGPGYVAGAAAARGAEVVGVDFSAEMVKSAKRRYTHVDFQEGDAESLSFSSKTFDSVVMNFGLLHLARPEAALREAYRVLRAGGRYAFTVWAPPDEAVGFGIVLRAIQTHGRTEAPLTSGPPFFRFSDSGESIRALDAAGFSDADVARVPQIWRLPSADALFGIMQNGTVRTAGLLRAQHPERLAAIRDAVRKEAERYRNGRSVDLPMPAVLASGKK